MTRIGAMLACLCAAVFVGLSAAASHGLQQLDHIARSRLEVALKMLIVHVLALLLVHFHAIQLKTRPALSWVSFGFLIGIAMFCGSLITLCFGGPGWLSQLAPIGGISFIVSWLLWALVFFGRERGR